VWAGIPALLRRRQRARIPEVAELKALRQIRLSIRRDTLPEQKWIHARQCFEGSEEFQGGHSAKVLTDSFDRTENHLTSNRPGRNAGDTLRVRSLLRRILEVYCFRTAAVR
jgi:hypothetical protein